MTEPRICSNCGASPTHAKGLCSRCYQRERNREYSARNRYSQSIDRTAYLGDVTARNRSWIQQQLPQKAAPTTNPDPNVWMTYREAATFWGVPYTVAMDRIRAHQMSRQHVGRMALVRRADVEAYRSLVTVSTSHPAVE